MTETWSYRRAYAELDALVYSLKYDGMFNRLVFDSPSRVCEHQISPKKGVEMKGRMVVWDRNFCGNFLEKYNYSFLMKVVRKRVSPENPSSWQQLSFNFALELSIF